MTKFIDKRIKVMHDYKNNPRAFLYRGKWLPVCRVLEMWKDAGKWWDGEAEKTFYRVEAAGSSLYELYVVNNNQAWSLYRIYD
ncbi:MAG: DUF6504 family protein [Firmicutes bacterium]|nr:DUF6504 family protein [Bacillota bacterium]